MKYKIGDELVCISNVNALCLSMSNPSVDINCRDKFKITDVDDYPDENVCHWYELTSKNGKHVFDAWDDCSNHEITKWFEII